MMKEIGAFTIDEMGRIVIPSELRNMLGWEKGSELSMYYADNNTAILQPCKKRSGRTCDICEDGESSVMIKGHKICSECVERINDLGRFNSVSTAARKVVVKQPRII